MTPEVTMCVCSFNAWEALALCVESFRRHHAEPVRLYVLDNGSTDGALEYARDVADLVLEQPAAISHGENLTALIERVETPYVLTVDNDIEFHAPVLDRMRTALTEQDAYCACLSRQWALGTFDIYGVEMKAMWSPNIAVGLMDTAKVHRLMQWATFGYYMNEQRREHGETGAMIYRLAMASGYHLAELPDLWECLTHHGQISTLFRQTTPDPALVARYEVVKDHLQKLRGRQETPNA